MQASRALLSGGLRAIAKSQTVMLDESICR
jgi:hypothetical protein